jgi:hypothetical protein
MQFPNGKDMMNGSADFENHSNPSDFKNWLDEGLNIFKTKK